MDKHESSSHDSGEDVSNKQQAAQPVNGEPTAEELERIHTFERVGTHAQYYEKGGLRTEGDGQDHSGANFKMTFSLFMALVGMAFLWVGSQIPLYLFGGIIADIYADIGGVDRWVWFVIGYLIPNAALCPFVGNMSDLFGRKWVAIGGQVLLIIGPIVTCTAHTMNVAIAGQVLSGVGAGINELIALAGAGELVPTSLRAPVVGIIVMTILPFAPSVLYAQLIHQAAGWRYVGILVSVWNLIGLVLVLIFYNPPPRINAMGYTKRQILARIDFIGAILSIGGVLCFMMGMQFSAIQYTWQTSHVLSPFIIGIVLIISFFVWEMKFARYPFVPHRMFSKARKTMTVILLITFLSGANFFAVLLLWPTQIYNVYGPEPLGIGIRSLPIGFGILFGAVFALAMIPLTGGRIQYIMIFWTAAMTAGCGAVSISTPTNIGTMWGLITLASLGVGAVIIPCTIIAQICCPDDVIATVTAITLSVRYIGGAVGFTVYFNVFYSKLVPNLTQTVALDAIIGQLHYGASYKLIYDMTFAVGFARFDYLKQLIAQANITDPNAFNIILGAAQWGFSEAYSWVYWISIAFGGSCFILSFFLGDIKPYLDDHIAVVG